LTKRKKDWKEIFDFSAQQDFSLDISGIHGRNQWPQPLPLFKEKLLEYFEEMRKIGLVLMRAIFHGLSESSVETFMEECFAVGEDTSFGRLNFYPVCPFEEDKDQLGVGPHSDAGVLTILFQEEGISSLQVFKEGVWHDVPPIKDTFVVNIGLVFGLYIYL
jgi:isopenicillin N synthase-like dioxygenase